MSVDPFSHTTTRNVLDHILVPTIVGSTAGYEVKLNMTNLNTVYSSQIGDTSNRVKDIWVNTLHWNTLDPVINSGGTAGSGSTGASGPAGVTGPTGPAGPTGRDGAGVTQVSGSTGQVLYYTGNGITSQSNFSVLNGTLSLPTISSDVEIVNASTLILSTQSNSSQIESGQINAVGSGNSLIISDVGYTTNTATFDTLNSRVGIRTDSPQTELDVRGQATVNFDGSIASTTFTVLVNSTVGPTGTNGITLAPSNTYNIYGWGQGGYNNGGQGGAGGYLKAIITPQTPTYLSWNSLLGGSDMNQNPSGGNALQLFVGSTLSAVVSGGGGGTTGAAGAGAGLPYGNPLPQSGYSAGTAGGTGGYIQTPGAIVTIQGAASASISNITGSGYIDYGATGIVPAGTIITYAATTTLDATRGNGELRFIGAGVMSNPPPVVTIAGSTAITFLNTPYTTSSSGSTLTTAGPITAGITGITLVNSTNTSNVDLNIRSGTATTTGPVTGFTPQQTISAGTVVVLPANILNFIPPIGLTGRSQFTITSGDVADYLIDTTARTVRFSRDSTMTFNCRIITSDIATNGTASITGFVFPVRNVNLYAGSGSQFVGATGSGGGGGGAGYYGGGAGTTGGGGGAGSNFISGFTGQFLSGTNVSAPLSKFNTLATKHGWAGASPNLPRIVIEQYVTGSQQPALIVNGGVIAGSSGSTFTNLLVNGQTEITGTLQIDGSTSGTQQSALVVNGTANINSLSISNGPLNVANLSYNLSAPTSSNQLLGNVLCNSLTANGSLSAGSFGSSSTNLTVNGAANIDAISVSNANLNTGGVTYNVAAPGGSNQLLGNVLCNSVTTTGSVSAGVTLSIGSNFQIYQENAGSVGGVTGNRTVIQQQTGDSVNQAPNIILIRPTGGPPQGLSITHQTGMTYTNNCLVSVDGDLSVTGRAQINGSLTVAGPIFASNFPSSSSSSSAGTVLLTSLTPNSTYTLPPSPPNSRNYILLDVKVWGGGGGGGGGPDPTTPGGGNVGGGGGSGDFIQKSLLLIPGQIITYTIGAGGAPGGGNGGNTTLAISAISGLGASSITANGGGGGQVPNGGAAGGSGGFPGANANPPTGGTGGGNGGGIPAGIPAFFFGAGGAGGSPASTAGQGFTGAILLTITYAIAP
jgi:collagen type VII alpha